MEGTGATINPDLHYLIQLEDILMQRELSPNELAICKLMYRKYTRALKEAESATTEYEFVVKQIMGFKNISDAQQYMFNRDHQTKNRR